MPIGIQLVMPKSLDGEDGSVLLNALRRTSPVIAEMIDRRIMARTERLTGALREAETGQPYTGDVTGTRQVMLARWYADDGPQLDAWGRVYVPYQEGPPLGLPTYTNPARHMFADVETEDIDLIQAWAEASVQAALDSTFGGTVESRTVQYDG